MNDYLHFSNNSFDMYACQQESDPVDPVCDSEVEMIFGSGTSPQSSLSGSSYHVDKFENNNCLQPGVHSNRVPLNLMKVNEVEMFNPIVNIQHQNSGNDSDKTNQAGLKCSEISPPQCGNEIANISPVDLSPVSYQQLFSFGGMNSAWPHEYPIGHSSLREEACQESRNSLPHGSVNSKSGNPVSCSTTDDMASIIDQLSLNDVADKSDGAIWPQIDML